MPTYEYRCTRCGQITEEFKPVSAPRRQRCPACRGKVERMPSGGTGVLFKGSGFYVTDSRAKAPSPQTAKPDSQTAKPDPQTAKGSAAAETAGDSAADRSNDTPKGPAHKK